MSEQTERLLLKWGLVPLRFVVGLVFFMHGWQKVFGFGLSGTADIMGKLGLPVPMLCAAVVMTAELLGGAGIIVGLFTRWAGLALALDMLVAIPVARMHGGFFTPYGYELELTLLGACLTLAALGSGPMSIEAMLRRPRE